MPFCTAKDCYRKGQSLPLEEFKGKDRIYKQCSDCRSRQLHYKQNGGKGITSKGFKLHITEPGTEPKFLHEGHKKMWQEWLRGLVEEVER